jgi:N-acyl-D-aspartate/D-glutamate deacylase
VVRPRRAKRTAGAHTKFLTAGRFPTEAIVKFSGDKQWLTLEDIHWRLSALPAFCVGLRDRGFLCEGAPARATLFSVGASEKARASSTGRDARPTDHARVRISSR